MYTVLTKNSKFVIIINNYKIEYNSSTEINYSSINAKHTLLIKINEQVIKLNYTLLEKPLSTPWHTECEEDVNIGLWIYNVMNSELRRSIFLEH